MRYRFSLVCPDCKKQSETITDKLLPRIKCGDCLMDRLRVVEFNVVAVEVIDE